MQFLGLTTACREADTIMSCLAILSHAEYNTLPVIDFCLRLHQIQQTSAQYDV